MKKTENSAVVTPNSVAEIRGVYKRDFLDLFDMILHEIGEESDHDICEYELHAAKYKDAFGITLDKNYYPLIEKKIETIQAVEPLATIYIDGWKVHTRFFQASKFNPDTKKIILRVDEDFKKLIVRLLNEKGKKVYYGLSDTLRMRSEYSKRFYPILLERVHKNPGDRMNFSGEGDLHGVAFDQIYKIEDFRKLLNIPKTYITSRVGFICNQIAEEIYSCTPYEAHYFFNKKKNGRGRPGVTHICWTMEKKEAQINRKKTVIKTEVIEEAQSEPISDRVQWLMALSHLGEDSAASIIRKAEKYGRDDDYILKAYSTACSVGADSLGAMLSYFMNHEIENPVSIIKRERVELANERHLDYNAVAMEELMERLVFDDDEDGTKTGEPEFFEEAGSKKDIDGQLGFNV